MYGEGEKRMLSIIGLIWMGFGCGLGFKGDLTNMCLMFIVGLLFEIFDQFIRFRIFLSKLKYAVELIPKNSEEKE